MVPKVRLKPCDAKPGSCRALNLVYKVTCLDCKAEGLRSTYVGESHRSFWDRSQEHLADLRSRSDSNSLVKHWNEIHGNMDAPPKYQFQVLKKCKTSLERQIWEAILIDSESEGIDHQINQKGEFGINLVPKLKPTLDGELQPDNINHQGQPGHTKRKVQPETGPSTFCSTFDNQYTQRVKRRKLIDAELVNGNSTNDKNVSR